jgi:Protein of unknown function (DUF4239)
MSSVAISFFVFTLTFAGALIGMALRRALPQDHLGQDAKDTMRLAVGLVITMTGLVLGMLVSSAKTYYDSQKSKIAAMSTDIILLDTSLTAFGPEAAQARVLARMFVEDAIDRIWPSEKSRSSQLRPKNDDQTFTMDLQLLVPKNDAQTSAKTQIESLVQSMKKSYWLMFLESEQALLPMPLLVVVTSWLVTIFISFGIFAPPNPTVVLTLIICALAVSAAIFIIMEMYSPFSGVLRISSAPVRDALNQMAAAR